jgi:small-conductance mechanosensitive channel
MKSRIFFYGLMIALVTLDAYLISNPNLLGKLGFIVYKYSYLRTFPMALLTVSMVVGAIILVTEGLIFIAKRQNSKTSIKKVFIVIILLLIGVLVKTELDFQSWSYNHTGYRLRYGAFLLPVILILIVLQGYIRVLRNTSLTEGNVKS